MTCKIAHNIPVPLHSPFCDEKSIDARFVSFSGLHDQKEHIAIIYGDALKQETPLIRVHSECFTGDIFLSQRCDCGEQLTVTKDRFEKEGGILLYLRQEGRGIGLYEKLKAYNLQQNKNMDTFEANIALGHQEDERDFTIAAEMLKALDIHACKILTNNPSKADTLSCEGIHIKEIIPMPATPNPHNASYLAAKAARNAQKIKKAS